MKMKQKRLPHKLFKWILLGRGNEEGREDHGK
jgi:hypothetical protein